VKSIENLIKRNWRSIYVFVALFVDVLAIVSSAAFAALFLYVIPLFPSVSEAFFEFFVGYVTLVVLFVGPFLGLYRASFHSNLRQQNRIAGKAYFYTFLITLASFTAFKVTDYQRGFIFPFFIILPAFYTLYRYLLFQFNAAMQKRGFGVHNVLIVGYENGGMQVFDRFTGFPELGYNVKGYVSKRRHDGKEILPLQHYTLKEVEEVVKREKIDRAFIPSPKFITNGYSELIDICKKKRIKLKVLSPESDELMNYARVHDIAGITLYAPPRTRVDLLKRIMKRGFDIVGAIIAITLLSPVFVVTALAIHWESGRPIFFKQKRSALKGGKIFYFHKFRSMIKNADELKDSLYLNNETDGALFKMKNDPRRTKVGRFIRRYSIDELPQLLNVLKGDMSLVGPRPLPVKDFEKVKEEPEFWEAIKDREKLKPGITGLWQISGRSHVGFREMVLLDLYYTENQSMLFDLEILFATVPVVLFGKGAY